MNEISQPLAAGAGMTTLPDPAAQLAAFPPNLRAADIPSRVRERAVHHILDAVGIAYVSSRAEFAHRTLSAIAGLSGPGSVPVVGMPARLPPRDAALVNGVLCHGLDFDDTHLGGIVHSSSSSFPAALSAAILAGASGEAMLIAYIVSMEVTARIGAVGRGAFHERGFHPTGTAGVFGATLAPGGFWG